jgi:hypothetical protein
MSAQTGRVNPKDEDSLLTCESCGAASDERAESWRAPLGREDDDRVVTVVLCPECAQDVVDNT